MISRKAIPIIGGAAWLAFCGYIAFANVPLGAVQSRPAPVELYSAGAPIGTSANPLHTSGGAAVPTMASTGFSAFTDPQGSNATLSDTTAGIVLRDAGNSGSNLIRTACKNAPATPYTVIAKLAMVTATGGATDDWAGMLWRKTGSSGTAPMIMSGRVVFTSNGNPVSFYANDFTNYDTWAGTSTQARATDYWWAPEFWVSLKDDGTTVTYGYGADGVTFETLFTGAKSAGFLGSGNYNQVCLFVNAKGDDTAVTLESYKETSP